MKCGSSEKLYFRALIKTVNSARLKNCFEENLLSVDLKVPRQNSKLVESSGLQLTTDEPLVVDRVHSCRTKLQPFRSYLQYTPYFLTAFSPLLFLKKGLHHNFFAKFINGLPGVFQQNTLTSVKSVVKNVSHWILIELKNNNGVMYFKLIFFLIRI